MIMTSTSLKPQIFGNWYYLYGSTYNNPKLQFVNPSSLIAPVSMEEYLDPINATENASFYLNISL